MGSALLRRSFNRWVEGPTGAAADLRRLQRRLAQDGIAAYAMGGAVRGACLVGSHSEPRDVDVAVCADDLQVLSRLIQDCEFSVERRTNLGGLKVRAQHSTIDLWLLKDTPALRLYRASEIGPRRLAASTPLDIESVVVELQPDGEVVDHGFSAAIERQEVDLNCCHWNSPAELADRCVSVAAGLAFQVGPKAKRLIRELGGSSHQRRAERTATELLRAPRRPKRT